MNITPSTGPERTRARTHALSNVASGYCIDPHNVTLVVVVIWSNFRQKMDPIDLLETLILQSLNISLA